MKDSTSNVLTTDGTIPRQWYKEPYVWLIIGIPSSAVIVGMIMLWLSIVSFDGLVADDYYKKGMQIDQVLNRERAATALQLKGEFRLGASTGETVSLNLAMPESTNATPFSFPEVIDIELSYATSAGLDESFQMTQTSPGQYQGPTLSLPPGRWYVYVGTQEWRLNGELTTPGGRLVALTP